MPAPMPHRPVIVIDSSKLDYFARAAMVRAGTYGTYGLGRATGIHGLGAIPNPAATGGGDDHGNCFDPNGNKVPCFLDNNPAQTEGGGAPGQSTAQNTSTGNGTQTIGNWLLNLGNAVFAPPKPAAPPMTLQQPSVLGGMVPLFIVGGVLAGAIFYFKSRK